MNTPSVRTAEITWLSVREDMNIPIAIRAHPTRKNANIDAYAVTKYTSAVHGKDERIEAEYQR